MLDVFLNDLFVGGFSVEIGFLRGSKLVPFMNTVEITLWIPLDSFLKGLRNTHLQSENSIIRGG